MEKSFAEFRNIKLLFAKNGTSWHQQEIL